MHFPFLFVLVCTFGGFTSAFWRMACPNRLMQQRIDPLIFPGYVGAHVHTVAGGNGFGFNMTYASARASKCSSCPIQQDLSAYWTPKLYYQFQNGSFQAVPQVGDGYGVAGGMTIYYLQRPGPNNDSMRAFPPGFRMIAGNPFKRNYTGDFPAQAITYTCLNDSTGTQGPQTHNLPLINCPNGLRAQVFFPSCWDGVSLDPPDHASHMAYPASGAYNNGPCPASHPVRMISLFYEITYQTNLFTGKWYGSGQPFVFAQGDPTGYGFHGDFINGWDTTVLQNAINNCNDDSGVMQLCPYFTYFSSQQNKACAIPPYVQEDVNGPFDALPGCNPVQPGPGLASNGYATCNKFSTIGLTTPYLTDVTKSLKYKYLGCGLDYVANRTFTGPSLFTNDLTVESCIKFCNSSGYALAGMEYMSQCYCGNTIASDRLPQSGIFGDCTMPCAGNSSEVCGGSGMLSLYQKCTSSSTCTNSLFTPVGGKPKQEP